MNTLRHYTLNTVQFLLENPLMLLLLSVVLSSTYASYRLLNIINEPYNLDPQTLAMFEEFFKTPFGIYLFTGALLAYLILYTFVFFLILYLFSLILDLVLGED